MVKSKTLTLAKGSILETTDGINRVVVISIQKTQHHLMDNKGQSDIKKKKMKLDRRNSKIEKQLLYRLHS